MLTIIFTQNKLGYVKGQKVKFPNALAQDLVEHNEAVYVNDENLVEVDNLANVKTRAFSKKPNV
jgi:hypothetical protein